MNNRIQAETIITGHANADFDCLAAIVAAGVLYPEARLVFPGSQEKNLRNYFIQSACYLFNFANAKDIDASSVKTLVVVDTRQRSRLPHVRQVLENQNLTIHVYDHHPDSDEDLPADFGMIKKWGSTAAIMTQEIIRQSKSVSPEEATVIGLGIYEDTGSFTFNSTTAHDLSSAAWLMARGMDVNVISDLLTRDLTADQVSMLNALLENATTHDINGVEVVFAEASSEQYLGDFALLAHKLMDMENLSVLFALGRMQDRITLVARSRAPEVDVSRICEFFGGGGHPYAASASIKDRTMTQTKDELFALLYSEINPHMFVGAFMSGPAITIGKKELLKKATEIMTRFGLKAMPVVDKDNGRCVGIIEHQLADKAVAHGLGNIEVREYMMRNIKTVTPQTDLYEAMEIILGHSQRLVPVLDKDEVCGVFTRTDMIRILIDEPARIPDRLLPGKKRERQIFPLMRERLPKRIIDLLRKAGTLAEENGYELYVVGGFVRDLLLGSANLDVDLVVEGDGTVFAEILAKEFKGRAKVHRKFRTAVVILPDDSRIDVATARLEYYEQPAALPTVELSSIKMDLYRRDFTINALAVHLNPKKFGKLVDFFGAQRDIKDRVVRVLHSLSFVEDPTRILRAIRFEQRFRFNIGGQTERLIKNAVAMDFFDRLSGSRIFHELKLIFQEKNARQCLVRMGEFQILKVIHPKLELSRKVLEFLEQIEEVLDWYRLLYLDPKPEPWMLFFLGLVNGMEIAEVDQLAVRLNLSKREHNDLVSLRLNVEDAFYQISKWKSGEGPASDLYFLLEPLPLEGILYLLARSRNEDVRRSISHYLSALQHVSIDITGSDLQNLGLPPGPAYGKIIRTVTAAKIDGHVGCREDQLDLARTLIVGTLLKK
jgi:tRNA nucleotidyltransferase (CCA-adding enzyme)